MIMIMKLHFNEHIDACDSDSDKQDGVLVRS